MLLTEKYEDLIESKKFSEVGAREKSTIALILESQAKEEQRILSEGTVSSDVAQFVPLFMPLTRRVMPALIANEILGVQPMTTPTGYIYTLAFRYVGSGTNAGDKTGGRISPVAGGQILQVNVTGTALVKGDTIKVGTDSATVIYVEDTFILIDTKIGTATADLLDASGAKIGTITTTFSNELGFRKILRGYTGSLPTTEAELLGYDMAEVGFEIQQTHIAAQSRKLKAEYTVEMYQDLKAMHGLNADEELMNMMAVEVQNEMDREILNTVNSWAAPAGDFVIGTDGSNRTELESMTHLGIKISNESREIARLTRRGAGNILIVSPKVATVLENLKGFYQVDNKKTTVDAGAVGVSVIGTFNKMKVVMDSFASTDYITVLYKGVDRSDAIGVYAPYVPVSFTRVVNPANGQPAIILSTRYGIKENPMNNKDNKGGMYARTFSVNFSNSFLNK